MDGEPTTAPAIRIDGVEPLLRERGAPYFIGVPPAVRPIHQALGTGDFQVNVVSFEADTRSRPHVHTTDQVLYYVSGTGVVALAGGADQRVEAGEFVLLPAGVVHLHGASADGPAVHISITREVE